MEKKATETDITYLPGVGPRRAELLRKELGISTFGDLIRFYPFRYLDRSSTVRIADIVPDMAYVQIRAKVVRRELYGAAGLIEAEEAGQAQSSERAEDSGGSGQTPRFNSVKRMRAIIEDEDGSRMETVYFKGIKWMYEKLEPGRTFIFFGRPTSFNGRINMVHPEVDAASDNARAKRGARIPEGCLTGIYPSTDRLRNGGITEKVMNRLQATALEATLPDVKESLPEHLLKKMELVPIHYALRNIHFPVSQDALAKARRRLKFEELFYLQLSLLKQKYVRSRSEHGIRMPKVGAAFNRCYESLPFQLTGAQKKVITEIREDMRSGHQMNRLLQGDVGSGKTMVAVLTALIAIGNGYQACIMAPTEVLAQQHFRNISKYVEPAGVKVVLLTGSSRTAERRAAHQGLEDGSIQIAVGTHALLEDNVLFRNLGLAVIDEQHRFGVEQRARLWRKSTCGLPPHVLVMTATPIPRTLAMTLYGDLDVSVIDELPPGRKPVLTMHATEGKREALYKFMRDQIAAGRQVFVVYPLIFESQKMDYKNLEQGYEQIMQAFPFPPYRTAIVHGQQSNEDKKFNMDAFAAGRADILVATSVIEVGVDVPNASVMVIESAERFGLSQLHQLRGRVGRGSEKSYCVLMTGHKISEESRKRIDLMCATENGFELAEEDMKMRGPGDLEGTQQSGLPVTLSIASLARDGLLLNEARQCAEAVLRDDPTLSSDKNEVLREELRKDKYNIRDYSKIS